MTNYANRTIVVSDGWHRVTRADRKGLTMANKNTYQVIAYNANGGEVYGETTIARIADARRVAREFLTYCNVYTVDIVRNGDLIHATRFVKLSPRNGIVIDGGNTKNIRF